MAKVRGEKLKGKGKRTISQPDADTGVVPPSPISLCDNSETGFIFMCNAWTKPECYRYRVFGLPAGRREDVEKVKKGMKLFLFDFDVKLLYGVYEATSDGQMNLESSAFGGKFPAQVSFAIHKECLPLRETAFKFAIRDNYKGFKFKAELTRQQVKDLLSLFPALTAASVPSQAIRRPALGDQFQPSVMLPPSEDPYLTGAKPGYAAPIVQPHFVQQWVLNGQHYYAESQRPYLAEDTAQISRDCYSRYMGLQQMAPRDQFANIAAGYNTTYPTTATSHCPQLTFHHLHGGREFGLQREDAARTYTTYPIPATSQGPLAMHPHKQFPGTATTYPIPATSQGPPAMNPHKQFPGTATAYPIPATSQGPVAMHPHDQFPGTATTYPFPATSQGPPAMHPHDQFPGTATAYPITATSQGPPGMHPNDQFPGTATTYPIPATSQGPLAIHPHYQFPGTAMRSFPVSSS